MLTVGYAGAAIGLDREVSRPTNFNVRGRRTALLRRQTSCVVTVGFFEHVAEPRERHYSKSDIDRPNGRPEHLMTSNVDLFADVAAALFVKLYAAFPIPIDIEIDVLADAGLPDADPSGATREAFVEASLHWLGAAGIVAFEPGQMGARMIEHVGLTARGFLALQASDGGDDAIGRSLGEASSAKHRRDLVGLALTAAR